MGLLILTHSSLWSLREKVWAIQKQSTWKHKYCNIIQVFQGDSWNDRYGNMADFRYGDYEIVEGENKRKGNASILCHIYKLDEN